MSDVPDFSYGREKYDSYLSSIMGLKTDLLSVERFPLICYEFAAFSIRSFKAGISG